MMKLNLKILYVELDDDISSLIKRIEKVKEPNLVLVFPKGISILRSMVALKMLREGVDDLEKNTLVVISDEKGQILAEQAGFEVVSNLPDFDGFEVERGKTNQAKKSKKNKAEEKDDIILSSNEVLPEELMEEKKDEIAGYWEEDKPDNHFRSRIEDLKGSILPKGIKMKLNFSLPSFTFPKIFRSFYVGIIIVALLIAVLVGALVLPKATIDINPKAETLSFPITVVADKTLIEIDEKNVKLPAQILSVDKQDSNTFATSAEKDVSSKAKGIMTVYNNYNTVEQPLSATTRFQTTDGKIFRTTQVVTVPGATKDADGKLVSSQINVPVIADQAGDEYNIRATDFKIPGFAGSAKYDRFYGRTLVSMSGGGKGVMKIVQKSDIDKAESSLVSDLREKAIEDLKVKVPLGLKLIEESIDASKPEFTTSNQAGEPADSFTATIKTKARGIAIEEESLKQLVQQIILNQMKDKVSKVMIKDQVLTYKIKEINLDKGQAVFDVQADQKIVLGIDEESFKSKIAGKSEPEAREIFVKMPEISEVKVSLSPFWVKVIPKKANRIFLNIIQ